MNDIPFFAAATFLRLGEDFIGEGITWGAIAATAATATGANIGGGGR